jgi:Flp pilus assembly pilin Flp
MHRFITSVRAWLRDERGQDLTEYGLLACLIAIVALVAVSDVGLQISDLWTDIVVQLAEVL